ncbi:hypothetical protein [Bartonella sp. CL74QHWL]
MAHEKTLKTLDFRTLRLLVLRIPFNQSKLSANQNYPLGLS